MAATRRTPCPVARPLAAVLASLALAVSLGATVPGTAPTYFANQPAITIPFAQEAVGRVKQVNLFYSTDQGQTWLWASSAQPGARAFDKFVAPNDGAYWFAVQSIDFQNQPMPATLRELVAQVKVIVDRRPPSVLLRQSVASRPGQVGVEWDIRDDHLDIPGRGKFALDYRVEGVTDWVREATARPAATGSQFWEGLTAGQRMTVRLRCTDAAGNEAIETTTITLAADGRPMDPPPGQPIGGAPGGGVERGAVNYIKSLTFSIPYTIPKPGPSGLSAFDLWFTKNGGQSWEKAPNGDAARPGGLPTNPGEAVVPPLTGKMTFTADADGPFGFLIVARNGVGIGDPDPRPGDRPRILVEVDTKEPSVLLKAKAGHGLDVRNVEIQWQAEDKNLTDRPVQLQYAEAKPGPQPENPDWQPIPVLKDPQPRAGGYTWTIGKEGPFKFWVRAVVRDKAGNIGVGQPKSLDDRSAIVVDLEVPRVEITGPVEAVNGAKPPER